MAAARLRRESSKVSESIDLHSETTVEITTMTLTQKITFVNMAFANLSCSICFSLLAPFFPSEANSKGVSSTVVGIIFGCFELVIFVTSPIFGSYLTRIGSRFMYLSGLFLCGACCVLFGFVDYETGTHFVFRMIFNFLLLLTEPVKYASLCFASRILEGVGASMMITASFAIIAATFPDKVGTMFGVLETFSGIGFMIGPTVGGALYQAGGFKLPFVVMGVLLLFTMFVTFFVFPNIDDRPSERKSILKALRIPSIALISVIIFLGSSGLGFFDPTVEPRIHALDESVSAVLVGLIFMAGSLTYSICAPLFGFVADKSSRCREMMVIGSLLTTISYLLLGPSPFLNIGAQVWLIPISLCFLATGLSCANIPAFPEMMAILNALGYEDNFETYGVVSGIFNSMWSLGAFLGPTIGGFLNDKYGFPVSCTIFAGVMMTGTFLSTILTLAKWLSKDGSREEMRRLITDIPEENSVSIQT